MYLELQLYLGISKLSPSEIRLLDAYISYVHLDSGYGKSKNRKAHRHDFARRHILDSSDSWTPMGSPRMTVALIRLIPQFRD